MRYLNNITYIGLAISCIAACFFSACTGDDVNASLGALPEASFAVVQAKDANRVTLVNKTNMPSIPYWSTSNGMKAEGDSVTFNFIFKGTYTITLAAVAHGGIDSVSKSITIDQNDPDACQGTVQGFIAGCSQKTWRLNPAAYAEMVGPDPGAGTWWGNGAAEVSGGRACDFNDEWTFHFDAEGTMNYDNKGDYFSEDYLGLSNNSCGVNADLTATQKPWASGTFHYTIIPDAGVKPEYGQLKVTGTGAHIGLARVTNGADNKSAPVESITYDIIGMEHKSGYDLLTLTINESSDPQSATWWTFTLRSY